MTSISESAGYKDFLSHRSDHRQSEGLRRSAQKELSKKVMLAMKQLKRQYRAVLSLRCFEQLSYSDVAVAMQCSEVRARVLFFRAKQALKKQLSHQGLSKSLLLMCLGLFGKLTAPAEAASSSCTVTAASTKVGLTAALIGTAGTKLGIATAAAVAIGLAGAGSVSVLSESDLPARAAVKSFHFTAQLRNSDPGALSSLSKGAYEQWFCCPEGVDGPMFMRMQRWDPRQRNELCRPWLQNGQGNFYYNSGEKRVYINNYRVFWSNLRVRCLPTDTAEFTDFLSQVEGGMSGVRHTRDAKTGLLVDAVDNRFVDARNFRTHYGYNTLDDGQFEYRWPAEVPVVDQRDRMHARGWTYFRVDGRIDDQVVSGRGQIPFVYNAFREHPAWVTLNIGEDIEIADCKVGARLCLAEGIVLKSYPGGTFFEGLARPWMGMHAIDTVRRDAVTQRVWFATRLAGNDEDAVVIVHCEDEGPVVDLVYTINLENDILTDIGFHVDGRARGSLRFSYLQDIDQLGDEFIEPVLSTEPPVPAQQNPGMLWLIHLAQGRLDK